MLLRKRKVVENGEDEQRVPDLLVHSTHEGVPVGKLGFVYMRNIVPPEFPNEPLSKKQKPIKPPPVRHATDSRKLTDDANKITAIENDPVQKSKSKPLAGILQFDKFTSEETFLEDLPQPVPVQKHKKQPFTLVDSSEILQFDDNNESLKPHRKRTTSLPKSYAELSFEELVRSFQENDVDNWTPKKTRKTRLKYEPEESLYRDLENGFSEIASNHGKRKKQVRSNKPRKPKSKPANKPKVSVKKNKDTSESISSSSGSQKSNSRSSTPVKVLQHMILTSDGPRTVPLDDPKRPSGIGEWSPEGSPRTVPLVVPKRLSVIRELSQEGSLVPVQLDISNLAHQTVLEEHVQQVKDGNTDGAKLSFQRDLEIMKINLVYMGQLAKIFDCNKEFTEFLQNALLAQRDPEK